MKLYLNNGYWEGCHKELRAFECKSTLYDKINLHLELILSLNLLNEWKLSEAVIMTGNWNASFPLQGMKDTHAPWLLERNSKACMKTFVNHHISLISLIGSATSNKFEKILKWRVVSTTAFGSKASIHYRKKQEWQSCVEM